MFEAGGRADAGRLSQKEKRTGQAFTEGALSLSLWWVLKQKLLWRWQTKC